MVIRTYTCGISFKDFKVKQRKVARKRLATIVEQLSSTSMDICSNYIDDVIEYFLGKADPLISDEISIRPTDAGKFGVNAIMTHLNKKYKDDKDSPQFGANHLHSSVHLLSNAGKGYYDRIKKLQQIMAWFKTKPSQMLEFLLWSRSVHCNKVFAGQWHTGFRWVDNFMLGIHKKFLGKVQLPGTLPRVTRREFISHLDKLIVEAENDQLEKPTDRRKSFINRCYFIKNNISQLQLHDIPTGWDDMEIWIAKQQLPRYKTAAWAAVVRSVIARVYVSKNNCEALMKRFSTARVSDLLKTPFKNKLKPLPYLMVSGPEFVIRRLNNENALKHMRKHGYFELSFKELGREYLWDDALTLKVMASDKMLSFIHHKKIVLKSMTILPPEAPSNDVDVQLVFSGPIEAFIATRHLKKDLKLKKRKQLAL